MRRALSLLLVVAIALLPVSRPAAAQTAQNSQKVQVAPCISKGCGVVAGVALDTDNHALPDIKVRLRDCTSGRVHRTQITNAKGGFAFIDTPAGCYVVEALDPGTSKVAGASGLVTLLAGASATSLVVKTSIATGSHIATTTGFFTTTAVAVLLAAGAVGVSAGVASSSPICSQSK